MTASSPLRMVQELSSSEMKVYVSNAANMRFTHQQQYLYSLIGEDVELKEECALETFLVSVSFGCVCAGTVLAWTSSVLPHITFSDENPTNLTNANNTESIFTKPFQITDTQAGFVGSIVALGAVTGALPSAMLIKKLGIKITLLCISISFAWGWLGTMIHSLESFLVGRFVSGVATGAVCVCVPIYVSEIADVAIRGILGSFFQVSFCFGILLVNIVGALVSWNHLSYWMLTGPILYFFGLLALPNLKLQAKTSVESAPEVDTNDHDRPISFVKLMQEGNNRRAMMVGLGLVMFQQLSGVNAVIFYTGSIFTAAGSSLSPTISTVIVTAAQLVISIASAACIERFNRRLFLLISSSGMTLSLSVLTLYFFCSSLPGIVPLISLIMFFLCYCAGYGPLPWLMMGEIYSAEFKSIGCSIATTFNWLLVFAVTSVFPLMCSELGESYTFLAFSLFNALAILFTWFQVPETRGKTSEEIQMHFVVV